jgi:hypothetical protein
MARALLPASFVREAPTNNQSGVPVTATRHCLVPVLPRRAKTSFPGRRDTPLRSVSLSARGLEKRLAGSAPPVPAPSRCATAEWPRTRLGLCDRHSSDTAHQHTQQDGRAALAPVCWLAPAPGASSPESALGVGPRLPQHEPGDLDTRDSEGENEPTLWAAPILVLF